MLARLQQNASTLTPAIDNLAYMDSLKERVEELMLATGWEIGEVARVAGVSSSAVSQWLGKGSKIIKSIGSIEAAERLEHASGFRALWIAKGLVPKMKTDQKPSNLVNLENNPDYPAIRRARFKLQAGADGYAIENDDTNGLPVVFRRDWFEMHNYKPEKMLAIRVAGASMEPSLFAGDLVIVNLAQDQPKDGNVFAVNYEGEMVIKRMVRDSGNWLLRSDNPDKARFSDKRCHEGCSVLGEIVYKQSERI